MASLLSEVTSNLAVSHAMKSAEQVYYGTKTIYSVLNTEATDDGSTSNNKGSNKKQNVNDQNKLKESIAAAKKVVDDALSGTGAGDAGCSNSELESLRQEVSALRLSNEQLRRDVNELKELVKKLPFVLSYHCCSSTGMLSNSFRQLGQSILVLGDGNLSFSLALAQLFSEKQIVASVIELHDIFLARYVIGEKTLKQLGQCPNIQVKFGVDATDIDCCTRLLNASSVVEFSDVIMNFPHHGGKTNLRKSRALLQRIFQCVSTVFMRPGGTKFHITFAKGQSGICTEHALRNESFLRLNELPQHNRDSWQPIYLGAESGLKVVKVGIFSADAFPTYQCSGYLNREQRFHNECSITLSFVKADNCELKLDAAKINIESVAHAIQISVTPSTSVNSVAVPPPAAAGDDDFDLFGSDSDEEESEEQKRVREERLSAYAAKKAKKPGPIAKSSVILDVKPWDDETDLKEMENLVRSIVIDGLVWGAGKLISIGYGIQKLQIVCTIEDEKVSVDADLVERIQDDFSDHVQSVDIVAFNKI